MSAENNTCLNGEREERHQRILPEMSKVDLNKLIKKVREEEKRSKRNNLAVSIAALSAAAIFGIILTL